MSSIYTITRVYIASQNRIEILNTQEYSPEAVQKLQKLNSTIFLSVKGEKHFFGLNYSELITDTTLGALATWDAVASALTDALILGYNANIPGYGTGESHPVNQVITWDAMTVTDTFDLAYSDYLTGNANIFPLRWKLKDLAINLQKDATNTPALAQCMPVVNGFFCRPVYREDTEVLYALGGAHLCWCKHTGRTPEVQLLDFSDIGALSCHDIQMPNTQNTEKAFTLTFKNRQREFDFGCDWLLTSKYSFKEYMPILVLGGVPVFPDQLQFISEHTFSFNFSRLPVHHALVYMKYLQDEPLLAGNAYETEQLIVYLKNHFNRTAVPISSSCFVMLIKTPSLYIERIPLDVWRNGIIMNLYSQEGMLLHDATGTVRVFHSDTLTDRKELALQNLDRIHVADFSIQDKQMAFIPSDCKHHNLVNIQESTCTMLHVMR